MNMNLVSALFKNSISFSNRPAIIDSSLPKEKNTFSFAELAKLTKEYIYIFQSRGFSKNSIVIICMDNSVEYVAALYACWSLRVIVVPLHGQSKPNEIWKIHKATTAKILIRKKEKDRSTALNFIETLETESAHDTIPKDIFNNFTFSENKFGADILTNDVALILFTSGTTGNPKGVTLTHKNLLANSNSIVSYLKLSERDHIYNVLPFTYSYGNSILHSHILAGGCVQLGYSMMYPQQIATGLLEEKITGFAGVPTTFHILLNKTSFSQRPPKLRYITQAGGRMSMAMTSRLLTLLPNTAIFIMYGQTEATARLTYLPPEKLLEKAGSVGIAIPGVKISVHSATGQCLEPNMEGEIVAYGDNVMQGYWNNASATKEILVNGWLRTGDVGHIDDDGFLFLKGRHTQMIKSGANRIHPGEIEELISEIDSIAEVAVIGIPDALLGEVIAAYLVLREDCKRDDRAILKYCRENLSPHKQPKKIAWVAELPRTSSGKIKKHLLPKISPM